MSSNKIKGNRLEFIRKQINKWRNITNELGVEEGCKYFSKC